MATVYEKVSVDMLTGLANQPRLELSGGEKMIVMRTAFGSVPLEPLSQLVVQVTPSKNSN